jgi:uncharacterized C2H2 Zn-finger protein
MTDDRFDRKPGYEPVKCRGCRINPVADHLPAMEGGEAAIRCPRCGIKATAYDDFNDYLAEKKATKVWNKAMGPRKRKVKNERRRK